MQADLKNFSRTFIAMFLFAGSVVLLLNISSCGKQSSSSQAGLNIQYEIINLSPDINPVNLYIDFKRVNSTPYIFSVNQGYFYIPSTDTPYQIRTAATSGVTLLSRSDILKSGLKYSMFIVGDMASKSAKTIFTVDTSTAPASGRGKIRFVNASPTGTSGLDLFANGTPAFNGLVYPQFSKYIEIPVGNYNFQINTTGTANVLKTLSSVTIQDGRLYTIYAYGYTSRVDTAAFNAGVITNK